MERTFQEIWDALKEQSPEARKELEQAEMLSDVGKMIWPTIKWRERHCLKSPACACESSERSKKTEAMVCAYLMWSPSPKPSDCASPSQTDFRAYQTTIWTTKTTHPQRHIGAFSVLEYLFKKYSGRKRSEMSKKIRAMPGASPSKSRTTHDASWDARAAAGTSQYARDLLVSGFCASSSDRSHRLHDSNVQMLSYLLH